jgi:hypothetical protein
LISGTNLYSSAGDDTIEIEIDWLVTPTCTTQLGVAPLKLKLKLTLISDTYLYSSAGDDIIEIKIDVD